MASISLPTIPDFSAYWKGTNADQTFASTLTAVATSAVGGTVDPNCYTASYTIINSDGLVDAIITNTVSLKSDNSGLNINTFSGLVPLGTYSY